MLDPYKKNSSMHSGFQIWKGRLNMSKVYRLSCRNLEIKTEVFDEITLMKLFSSGIYLESYFRNKKINVDC